MSNRTIACACISAPILVLAFLAVQFHWRGVE